MVGEHGLRCCVHTQVIFSLQDGAELYLYCFIFIALSLLLYLYCFIFIA
jgi:hypothetical protein